MTPSPIRTQAMIDILRSLARRVETNLPDSRNPERFHCEKSEIGDELKRMARRLERGVPTRGQS